MRTPKPCMYTFFMEREQVFVCFLSDSQNSVRFPKRSLGLVTDINGVASYIGGELSQGMCRRVLMRACEADGGVGLAPALSVSWPMLLLALLLSLSSPVASQGQLGKCMCSTRRRLAPPPAAMPCFISFLPISRASLGPALHSCFMEGVSLPLHSPA